jgi:hypothetical protein
MLVICFSLLRPPPLTYLVSVLVVVVVLRRATYLTLPLLTPLFAGVDILV